MALKDWLGTLPDWRQGLVKASALFARAPNGDLQHLKTDSAGALVVTGAVGGGDQGSGGAGSSSSGGLTREPVTASKAVNATRQELFALSNKQAGRYGMGLYNAGDNPIYWGGPNVTVANGFPLQPKEYIVINFDPDKSAPIHAIAEAATQVRIVELS